MSRWRDIKRRMRRDVHDTMRVPALYLATRQAVPVPCMVRLHTKFSAVGDLPGGGSQYAERMETTPRVILDRNDVEMPDRNGIISVAPGEAYRILSTQPADGEFVTVNVAALPAADAASLPVPEAS